MVLAVFDDEPGAVVSYRLAGSRIRFYLISYPGQLAHYEADRKRPLVQGDTDRGWSYPPDMAAHGVHLPGSVVVDLTIDHIPIGGAKRVGVPQPNAPGSCIKHVVSLTRQHEPGPGVRKKCYSEVTATLAGNGC